MNLSQPQTSSAATDVTELIQDLDAGLFDRKFSVALSTVAAACVDHNKAGEVTVKFAFKKVPGSTQVLCEHQLKFVRPTLDGQASEVEKRTTPLHVGKFGRLSIAPENQLDFLDRSGAVKTA